MPIGTFMCRRHSRSSCRPVAAPGCPCSRDGDGVRVQPGEARHQIEPLCGDLRWKPAIRELRFAPCLATVMTPPASSSQGTCGETVSGHGYAARNALRISGKVRTIRFMGTVEGANGRPSRSRVETIVGTVATRIERGLLRPGERLPSIRSASEQFGASKNTVVEAYERLVASGGSRASPASGFYVLAHHRRRAPAHATRQGGSVAACGSSASNWRALLGAGRRRPPPAAWMEASNGAAISRPRHGPRRRAARELGTPYGLLSASPARGRLLAERSIGPSRRRGCSTARPNDRSIYRRHFRLPGDAVLVDSPGYYPLFARLHSGLAALVGVRGTPTVPIPTTRPKAARAARAHLLTHRWRTTHRCS